MAIPPIWIWPVPVKAIPSPLAFKVLTCKLPVSEMLVLELGAILYSLEYCWPLIVTLFAVGCTGSVCKGCTSPAKSSSTEVVRASLPCKAKASGAGDEVAARASEFELGAKAVLALFGCECSKTEPSVLCWV